MEILLVEDNPGDVRLIAEVFKESNLPYNLSVVSDGIEALAFLRKREAYVNAPRPDLILLDLNLPRKSGLEVLEEIKADDTLKHTLVLVLTGLDSIGLFDTNNPLADGLVHKPADLEGFARMIDAIHQLGFTSEDLLP
ncbi:MAG: response regulator [Chloroflexota bacterium]